MPKTKGSVVRKSWPTISIIHKRGKNAYQVDGRPSAGRKFFTNKAEALVYAEELAKLKTDGGALALAMPAVLRQDALEAAEVLAPWGQSIVEAARHYVTFLKSEQSRANAITVKAAIADYLAVKSQEQERGEIAPLTLSELKSKLKTIESAFVDRRLIDIDQAAVQSFLEGLHQRPRGRANLRIKLSQLFNHARRRGWVIANPVELTSVRVPARDIAILTVAEATKLLRTAEGNLLLPYITLGLFAGLRPGEAQQIRWSDIHFEAEQIEIRPEITKTRQRRFVPLEAHLIQWLLPHRLSAGRIAPANFNKLWKALRASAGLNELSGQRSWQDLLRHTHASYWLALHGNRPQLAENLGNSVDVIRNFYRRAIPRTDAERFWNILPRGEKGTNVIAFAARR